MTAMAATKSASEPAVIAAEPQLFVADIGRACAYYASHLGFATVFAYGEPPFYAQVFRGGARLNLRHVDDAPIDARRREDDALLSATVTVDDATSLFREFEAAGASFHQGLQDEPWGARDFIVRDLDGNLILFSGRAD
jgi:uncharacterized glyoxalase superfamily protein PhnB